MDYSQSAIPKPKRKKKGPARKKPKPANQTNRIHALVRKIVLKRDRYCVTCGSTENLEVSHYLGRAKMGVAFDLRNCNVQCHSCHREYHNGSPEYMRYMVATYGEGILDELYQVQADWIKDGGASYQKKQAIYDDLQKVWDELNK